ncbi:MAG: hypothetical protein JXB47_02095 [Anaerolineae bacterium]|nr:hypothetical protein [Anaerolineae bacterium]
MSKSGQAERLKRLERAAGPAQRRDLALELLGASLRRDYVDAALLALEQNNVVEILGDAHRPVLRDKALFYFEHADKDRGGLIREKLTRRLAGIGHPGDIDIYLKGVVTYHRQPARDAAQNLRAAALVGLAGADQTLACAYAVKLLGEPDTSQLNGEPSMTAVRVLAHYSQALPLYQFVLLAGEDFIQEAKGEVVSQALESLGADFPPAVYAPLAERFAALDVPIVTSGIINHITRHRVTALYPLLRDLITETKHDDLHRYGVIMLAAARDDALTEMLYDLAKLSRPERIDGCIEAVELTPATDARAALLVALAKRRN